MEPSKKAKGPKVRLKIAGQSVNPDLLPEELILSFCRAFENETDNIAILSTYAYVFCGLRINDIRDMIVLTDKTGARTASREYVRQKIVSVFSRVLDEHTDTNGSGSISPRYRARNIDQTEVHFSRGYEVFKEDMFEDYQEEEDEDFNTNQVGSGNKEVRAKAKEKERTEPVNTGSAGSLDVEQRDHVNRPVRKPSGMVSLRGFLRRILYREKMAGQGINVHKDDKVINRDNINKRDT